MSEFSLIRNHLKGLEYETDRLMNQMDKLAKAHDDNRIIIKQADKEFANAKFNEDKCHEALATAWKATDCIKNKQRKLNRKQMELQTEQAEKWSQFKLKMAMVNELQILLGDPFAMPAKRIYSSSTLDDDRCAKKAKTCGDMFSLTDDEEEYGHGVKRDAKADIKASPKLIKKLKDDIKDVTGGVKKEASEGVKKEVNESVHGTKKETKGHIDQTKKIVDDVKKEKKSKDEFDMGRKTASLFTTGY